MLPRSDDREYQYSDIGKRLLPRQGQPASWIATWTFSTGLRRRVVHQSEIVDSPTTSGSGLDPPSPRSLDQDGAVIGYVFESKGFSRIDIDTTESDPSVSLAGQLIALPLRSLQGLGVSPEILRL
jgi:hypothetical protein